jgi:uncharacterized membrane protein YphA (DoxX/SURF4 family)
VKRLTIPGAPRRDGPVSSRVADRREAPEAARGQGRVMNIKAMRCAQVALGVLFVSAGAAKLAGVHIMIHQFDVIGLGPAARYVAGSLEIIAGLCLFSTRLAVYGAVLVSCITVGSVGATIGHAARVVIEAPPALAPQPAFSRTRQASLAHPAPRPHGAQKVVTSAAIASRQIA